MRLYKWFKVSSGWHLVDPDNGEIRARVFRDGDAWLCNSSITSTRWHTEEFAKAGVDRIVNKPSDGR
jgi:hypothetical protein